MTKKEVKQWIRTQIDSSIKSQDKHVVYLCYNKNYLRALKLSKITGQPVNKYIFKGCDVLFSLNLKTKEIWSYSIIDEYIYENYSKNYYDIQIILDDVLNEYSEYKGYKYIW